MKRRAITIITAITLLIGLLPCVSFAETIAEAVVFFNAETNSPIDELGSTESLYSKVIFTAPKTGMVDIITAQYNDSGVLIESPTVDSVEATENNVIEKTTTAVSVLGASTVKVFVWDRTSGASPVMKKLAVINKAYQGGKDFSEKFVSTYGTSDNPFIIVNNSEAQIGELLASCENTYIVGEYVSVTASSQDGGTASAVFTPNSDDWTKGTVKFSGEGLLKMTVRDYSFCEPTEFYVKVIAPQNTYAVAFENTDDYIYRVGNKNSVKLGSLFCELDTTYGTKNTAITVETLYGDAAGVYTKNESDWTQGTIAFSGTGVVKVTICDDYSNPVSVVLEVVDARNVTTYSELKNADCVLLNDITMSSNSRFYLSNATLYGNGFTFDVSSGAYQGTGAISGNYLLSINNAILDNVKVTGAVYTEYGATSSADYNGATVYSAGDSVIANSYISNCSAPVRVNGGNLLVKNSTLKGGNFANMDVRSGNITLEDVTTINQVGLNDTAEDGTVVIGLGIVVYYETVPETTTISVEGTLKQYNHAQKSDKDYVKASYAKQFVIDMFDETSLVYTDENGTEWMNTGILSMTTAVGDDNITDVPGYIDASPNFNGATGYVHAPAPAAPDTSYEYVSGGQYEIAPDYAFDFTEKNYVAKTEDSNRSCYYSGGTVLISFDQGDSFVWDTSILTVTDDGQSLDYTVTMDGTDYTGKSITFTESGNHTVTYTYTNPYNYGVDAEGNVVTYDVTYTKTVDIFVSSIAPAAKSAEFTFGSSQTASTSITIENDTYVMPNDTSLSYVTVSGNKIYCPTVEMFTSDGKWEHSSLNSWYACFPVFDGAVTITDYTDGGTGAAVTYNSSTQTLPVGLSVPDGPENVFIYQSSSAAPSEPAVVNNVLCYKSPTLSNNARSETNVFVKYKYVDNMGNTYYYYIKYHCKATTVKDSCVTPDTLVTLSDGSYKRIDEITHSDELIVWDFYEGKYTAAPSAIVFDHGYGNNTVIKLNFSDSTQLKVVNMHQFFNVEENRFVTIDAQNVKDYINKGFVKRDGDGYKTVSLTDYEISEEYIKAYGIISAAHYNILVEDMFSTDFMPEDYDLFNYFEVGNNMVYDEEKLEENIEKYGLYSYEEFSQYLTPEQFEAFNVKYMKISVGKGYYTYEGILSLVERYLK